MAEINNKLEKAIYTIIRQGIVGHSHTVKLSKQVSALLQPKIEEARKQEQKKAHFREIVLLTIISDMYSPQVRGKVEETLQIKIDEVEQALKGGE